MQKLHNYFMLFIFFAALLPAALPPVDVSAQGELTEVIIQPDESSGFDTYISSANTATNYATEDSLIIGKTSADEIGRALIRWDFSTLPDDAAVVTATLTLWVEEDLATNASTLQAYTVKRNWTENMAIWTHYADSTYWQTSGAMGADDILSTLSGSAVIGNSLAEGTEVNITLTPEEITNMIRDNYFGVLLKTQNETADAYSFYSASATDTTKRPRLTLQYDPNPDITEPGWLCRGPYCPVPEFVQSPFLSIKDGYVAGVSYNQVYTVGAYNQCQPYPLCKDDLPLYYRVKYSLTWDSWGAITTVGHAAVQVGTNTYVNEQEIDCDYGTSGECWGVMQGVILPEQITPAGDGYDNADVSIRLYMTDSGGWPGTRYAKWEFYLSTVPFSNQCSDTYVVPVIDTYVIDPTLEEPVGMIGLDETPTDEQGYQTIIDTMYMVRVQDGPWNDGTTDRYDTSISFDGTTYQTLEDFTATADVLCYDVDPFNQYWLTVYFTAPTETFFIRVNDLTGQFANNTNDAETPLTYSIGPAYLIDLACPQFSYSEEDKLVDIQVPSTDDDVPVIDTSNQNTTYVVGGEWYGIQVVDGTWHDNSPATERIDMEFSFIVYGPQAETPPWWDLAEGSPLVSCVSTDGKMVFVQAPLDDGIILHLRVNDPDDPQNFADNAGTLDVALYHVTNTHIPSGCEEQFGIDDLVASGEVRGDQIGGEGFGNSFSSLNGWGNTVPGGVSTSYYMTLGAWYMLETKDGPWTASSASGTGYVSGNDYYDIQLRRWSTDLEEEWAMPDDWELTTCVVNIDMLGHQRVYFRVPDNELNDTNESGIEFMVRVAGASNSTLGALGWDLYQAIDNELGAESPWDTCLTDYGTFEEINHTWIPVKAIEGATITQYGTGGGSTTLETGETYYLKTSNGPWQAGEVTDDRYDAELSSDGGVTWFPMGSHPDVTCGVTDQLGKYQTAIIVVDVGEVWKIRVADVSFFADNTGSLAYSLSSAVYTPTYNPGLSLLLDSDFDACVPSLIRPSLANVLTLPERDVPTLPSSWEVSDWVGYLGDWFSSFSTYTGELFSALGTMLGDMGIYLGQWVQYINRSVMTYFAWCPRHVNTLVVAIHKLEEKEPLASVRELETAADSTIAEVKSYDWGGGGEGGGLGDGYEDTSIFSFGEGGGVGTGGSAVDNIVEKILPTSGKAFDVWEGGDVVDFGSSDGLPDYYYTCGTAFANFLPERLRAGVCFASAYWKETGAAWWVQLALDIGTVFLLFGMIKTAAQSLVYMMTGVRPWTKDGAIKVIETVGSGGNVVQPIENWRNRR